MMSEYYPILKDDRASAKARGLYFTALAMKESFGRGLKKSDVARHIPDGHVSFDNTWRELKELGYIRIHATPCSHGWEYEIELVQKPNLDSPHTIFYSSNGKIIRTVYPGDREGHANGL